MFIKKLQISNFRGLGCQEVLFDKRVSIITGKNGQGKTSLIEAVYVLSQAKSFRTSKPKDMVSWNDGNSGLEAVGVIETAVGEKNIRYQLKQGKKKLLINDKTVTDAGAFFGQFQVVEFTPDDIQLISGSTALRRRFIDRLIAMTDSGFVRDSVNYHIALQNRNALICDSVKNKKSFVSLVKGWDEQLVVYGLRISKKRQDFISRFLPFFKESYRRICTATEEVSIEYEGNLFSDGQMLSRDAALHKYEEYTQRDGKYQSTTFGVHRDRVEIFMKCENSQTAQEARVYASQGQRKSIALALKLAAVEFLQSENPDGELPVLLLDDVDSELDFVRKTALYEIILNAKNQIFVSTTEVGEWLGQLHDESRVFRVEGGSVA